MEKNASAAALSKQDPTRPIDGRTLLSSHSVALGEVRRQVWNDARRDGDKQGAKQLKGARYALWKKRGDLTGPQQVKLDWIAAANKPLHRAYELKEAFRKIVRIKGTARASPAR